MILATVVVQLASLIAASCCDLQMDRLGTVICGLRSNNKHLY